MSASKTRRRILVTIASAAVVVAGAFGVAAAAGLGSAANQHAPGRGINEFGMTKSFYQGHTVNFTYTHGFYCDKSVASAAKTECEAGVNFKKAPSKHYDPLYITVPLGFSMPETDCPANLVCVDHPGTIDLSRLEPALKPLYPTLTDKQLTAALKNYTVPNHDHFITDLNNTKPEWWDVKVVGVLSPKTYRQIEAHKSYGYIAHLLKNKNANVVGPIDTNLFLYFAAK